MCLPAGILAQSGAASDSRYAATDTALVSHVFVGGRPDTIRVWLERHDIYHLEVYGRGAKVAIKPAGRTQGDVFLARLTPDSLDAPAVFDVYPGARGEHVLVVDSLAAGDTAFVRLGVNRVETVAQGQRRTARLRSSWHFGLIADGGVHSGFAIGSGFGSQTGPRVAGGSVMEMGIEFSSYDAATFLILGVSRAGAPDPSPQVTWAFVEPRVRAWRQNRLEVGVLGRLAKGNVSQSSNDPAYVAAGLWMAYRLSGEPGAAGLAFRGSSLVGTLVSANVGSSTLGQIAIGLVGRL
jgi:hypothetical protein